jgi:DNA invertase Pin-like site-specific DNA recombinase
MENAAVAVIRVSTSEQAEEGASLDVQNDAVRRYCELKRIPLLKIIKTTTGESARRPLAKRPGGQELLSLIATGKVKHVVATKLDRLFRNALDAKQHLQDWNKRGVGLHLLQFGGNGPVDTTGPIGRFFLGMLCEVAELESSMIGERVRDAKRYLKEHGQSYSAPPYGYAFAEDRFRDGKIVNRALRPVPAEQAVIKRIRRLRKAGKSYREVATLLNVSSVPTKKPRGTWHASQVRRCAASVS